MSQIHPNDSETGFGQRQDLDHSSGFWRTLNFTRLNNVKSVHVIPFDPDASNVSQAKDNSPTYDDDSQDSSRDGHDTSGESSPIFIAHKANPVSFETRESLSSPISVHDHLEILPRKSRSLRGKQSSDPKILPLMHSDPKVDSEHGAATESENTHTEVNMDNLKIPPEIRGPYPRFGVGFQNRELQGQGSQNATFQRIQRLRIDVLGLRSQVTETRSRLKRKLDEVFIADDAWIKRVRTGNARKSEAIPSHEPVVKQEKTDAELRQDCERLRDECGPLVDECRALEDQLGVWEFRQAKLEDEFYNRPVEPQMEVLEKSRIPEIDPKPPESVASLEELEDIETHPLVSEFLSRLGDLDLLRERHVDFVDEKEAMEIEQDSRQKVGRVLDDEDQAWLKRSTKVEEDLLQELLVAERDVADLRQRCLDERLVDENDEPTDLATQEQSSFIGDDVTSQGQISQYVKYPLLLPRPGIKLGQMDGCDPKPDYQSDIATDRINHWLLQRLRSTPLEVRLLASTFEGETGKLDDSWETFVLELWYNDDTIVPKPDYHRYNSAGSMSTHANFRSKKSEDYHF